MIWPGLRSANRTDEYMPSLTWGSSTNLNYFFFLFHHEPQSSRAYSVCLKPLKWFLPEETTRTPRQALKILPKSKASSCFVIVALPNHTTDWCFDAVSRTGVPLLRVTGQQKQKLRKSQKQFRGSGYGENLHADGDHHHLAWSLQESRPLSWSWLWNPKMETWGRWAERYVSTQIVHILMDLQSLGTVTGHKNCRWFLFPPTKTEWKL